VDIYRKESGKKKDTGGKKKKKGWRRSEKVGDIVV